MAKLIDGERIGQAAKLMVGTAAIIFDAARQKVLLTRRSDNGRWCLPGGRLEPGESAEEGCVREVWEETGLQVMVRRLVGIYSSPHRVIEYGDGSRHQIVAFSFEAEVIGGALGLSEETTAYGYFSRTEMAQIDVMEHHLERIADAWSNQCAAVVR
jgi:ADP-ribose pyrophosphatase YjhB (NUDIX family)